MEKTQYTGMRKALLSGVAAVAIGAFSAGAAQAADDWSGLYAGFHIGYGDANIDGTWNPSESPATDVGKLDLNGAVVGVQGGYNWQSDNIVYGVEIDWTGTFNWEDNGVHDAGSEGYIVKEDMLASLRGRLGMALDFAHVYVTGGIAFQDGAWERGSSQDNGASVNLPSVGGVVGAGIERFVTNDISLRAEGLVYLFGSSDELPRDFSDNENGGDIDTLPVVFRVGMTYRFCTQGAC